jgi:uncharacterized protein
MKINLKDLEEGFNHLSWVEQDGDLDLDSSEVQLLMPAEVEMGLTKSGTTLDVNLNVKTRIRMFCSRCLEPIDRDLDLAFELVFKKVSENTTKDLNLTEDELKVIEYEGVQIDMTERIRESIILEVPIKLLCSDNCKGLCPICGENLNFGNCGCKREVVDPRWKALEDLKKCMV